MSSGSGGRELIMHVGLPKTGSTMIQQFLATSSKVMAARGIGVLAVEGGAAHSVLGNYLLKLDDRGQFPDGYFLGEMREKNVFPDWKNYSKYLISSEMCYALGGRGVNSVVKYAQASKAALVLVCVVRRPSDWLLSYWTQITKTRCVDWVKFIEKSIETKEGFLSTALQAWLPMHDGNRLVVVKYEKRDLLKAFLGRLQMGELAESTGSGSAYLNVGAELVEVLYRSVMAKEICSAIGSYDRLKFEKADWGYVHRMLLDIADNGSPAFEFAAKYTEDINRQGIVLGADSHRAMSLYSRMWADDAIEFLKKAQPWLEVESVSALREICDEALADSDRFLNNSSTCPQWPQSDFAEKLPIDSQFIAMCRVLAVSILLGCRAFRKTSEHK